MDIFSWKIIAILLGIYLLIRLYKFNRYLKTYLIPFKIEITSNEIKNQSQELIFAVKFGAGFLKRKYFWTVGEMNNTSPLKVEELEQLLMLTKISTFANGNTNTEQVYQFISKNNPNSDHEYKIKFITLDDSVIDKFRFTNKS